MLKIGEFSKLSRVSIRMLRYYDEIGLLKPAKIDRFTDYRYYSEEQLPTVWRIQSLRDMGFTLAEIVKLIENFDDREQLGACLEARRAELLHLAEDTARKLTLLDTARNRLRKDCIVKYDMTVKTFPERYAATVRMNIPTYEDEGMVWDVLCRETDDMKLVPAEPCLCAVEFLDCDYKERDVEVEASKTVKGRYPDTEHVKFRTLPAVKAASCVLRGGYEQMPEVYGALMPWISENGYELAGPMFNIYHVSPHETDDPEEFITEVCCPIK